MLEATPMISATCVVHGDTDKDRDTLPFLSNDDHNHSRNTTLLESLAQAGCWTTSLVIEK